MTSTTPAGFRATWRYTEFSLWFYVVMAFSGPAARSGLQIAHGTAVARHVVILALIVVVVVWSCRPLVAAARAGLGRDRVGWRTRWLVLMPALAVVVVAWWPSPEPVGYALVPFAVAALIAIDLPARLRWWWVGGWFLGLAAIAGLVAGLAGRPPGFAALWTIGFLAVCVSGLAIFQVWLWELMLQVRSSGEAEAELAAVRERLRLAADLHDVQGHHLQVIALQAELAARQLERDPAAARTALARIQQVARDAMAETREVVKGYRRTTLREEVVNAAAVLEASGSRVEIDVPPDLDDPLFAVVLREATTNILRHSDAGRIIITGSDDRFAVSNDGAAESASTDGTGLAALTARAAEAGARLDVSRDGDWFRVEVLR